MLMTPLNRLGMHRKPKSFVLAFPFLDIYLIGYVGIALNRRKKIDGTKRDDKKYSQYSDKLFQKNTSLRHDL
jgi:hypothetical protein